MKRLSFFVGSASQPLKKYIYSNTARERIKKIRLFCLWSVIIGYDTLAVKVSAIFDLSVTLIHIKFVFVYYCYMCIHFNLQNEILLLSLDTYHKLIK